MSRAWMRRVMLAAGLAFGVAGIGVSWASGQNAQPEAPKQAEAAKQPEDPRIAADTGAEKANWPPATPWDHLHMLLEVDFGALDKAEFRGVQTLTLAARGKARNEVELDCGPDITIERMVVVGEPDARGKDGKRLPDAELKPVREGRRIRMTLPADVPMGKAITIKTWYACDFSKNRNVGLTWVAPREDRDSETDKNPVVYSQGQSEDNNRWFPCHDFPNERLTTEIIATVPNGYEVCSNGHLVKKSTVGDSTTFHWLQDQHHVYYLVTLVVGKYSVINLAGDGEPDMSAPRKAGKPLPILAYVPVGKEEACKKSMGETPAMIACFEKLLGVAYPWDKYAQVLVRGFPGGMENTSATTMGASIFTNGRGSDDLISHELAHQWFGDLVTCRGWEHIWLNEGWATYCEALWEENKSGTPDDEAYLKKIAGDVSAQRGMNRGSLPRAVPMVSNRYSDPDAPFSKPDNPYSKGSVVLHMLRERIGREAFFRGVHNYLIANREQGLVDTDTFRKALEEASGQSLDAFFDQWTKRPGFPRLEVKLAYDAEKKTLTVEGEQTQTVNADNPPYVMSIPVEIRFDGGTPRHEVVEMTGKTFKMEFSGVAAKPSDVVLDPRITNLAVYRITQELK